MDTHGSHPEVLHRRFVTRAAGTVFGIFVSMLLLMELGRWAGLIEIEARGALPRGGVSGVDSAVFALLGLLLGFTFSGANARYDSRRSLLGKELNAIGTAWERLDLLPGERQDSIRAKFRRYVDSLVNAYTRPTGVRASLRESPEGERARTELWSTSVIACTDAAGEKARMLVLPSLTEMFRLADQERHARLIHPPTIIFVMLGIIALTAALFTGYGTAAPERNWLLSMGVAAAISIVLYVIVDLEFPRIGLIRVDAFDEALVELRSGLDRSLPGAAADPPSRDILTRMAR